MSVKRARHRVRQFITTFAATFAPVDEAYVAEKFAYAPASAALLPLFYTMSRAEQHHSIDICRILDRQGHTDPDLHIAALLHDVGKAAAPPRLWERVVVVLIEALAPRRAEAWGQAPADGSPANRCGLRQAFVVRRHHARWGARMAAEAGAPAPVVALIRHHHGGAPSSDDESVLDLGLLAALQAADEA